ncbi:hypothetical protein RhiirA5_433757 [Rhizophagus irregularis]|uniref:Uncharacterized protein n=1 Tax=Rhizophagus irregularis TaxID=588596 RepID=A0A2N0NR84_9GLOM|nr:hypothetical protein RhiirA5_433757 [Rhizophagus irregularis]
MRINQSQSSSSQNPRSAQTNQVLQRPIEEIIVADFTLPPNAAAQKKAVETINTINTKLAKLQQVYNSTNDLEIQNNLLEHMTTFKQKHQEVVLYDLPGHPLFLTQYPNLVEHIHKCIEFGAADKKRRKEIIKVQTIPAKTYHHPAIIANASVSRNKRNKHIDEHYCFTFMKGANQFAALFSTNSIIISQDDKAKVPLGIPAQKLIPSVYLLINPSDTNDTFRNGQLSIFIRPQYQVGTSSATHMIDGSLDKNSRHMKNIYQYCRIFHTFDLDYLSIQTYAPSQSAYNPVERSMAMLSQKLASITLPINKYGSHLNSQGQVDDLKLAMINSCSGCFYNIPAFSKKSAIKQCCNNEKCFFQVAAYLRTLNNIYKTFDALFKTKKKDIQNWTGISQYNHKK